MIDCRSIARFVRWLPLAGSIVAMPVCAITAATNETAAKPAKASQTPAARLLELGERYSPTALGKARAYHDELRTQRGYDARVQYAFALVLIRQRSFGDAATLLGQIVAQQPTAWHLW